MRRLPGRGPLVFGRGLEITLGVDERAFEGASAFLLGLVLHRFFTRHVSINLFTETILRSESRGEIGRWGTAVGRETDAVAFLSALAEAPHDYDFFQTLRRLECLHADKPRWGEAQRPADEPVRLGQEPDLVVCPASLASLSFSPGDTRPRGYTWLFGLFGPTASRSRTDRICSRALAQCRRRDVRAVCRRVSSHARALLSGVGAGTAARQPRSPESGSGGSDVASFLGVRSVPFRHRDRSRMSAACFMLARFRVSLWNAEGLAGILRHFFNVPFALEQFVGHWMRLEPGERTFLGRDRAQLGTARGHRVWDRQHKSRLHVNWLTLAQYELSPGGNRLRQVVDWVAFYFFRARLGHAPASSCRRSSAARAGGTAASRVDDVARDAS